MFELRPVGILAIIAFAMFWSFAWVLYRTATPGSMARQLSLLLVVEGVTFLPVFSVSAESRSATG